MSTSMLTQPPLTQRQSAVLAAIQDHIHSFGAPPTRAEIAKKLGFKSVNAAEDHLKALARKGAIQLTAGTSRGIQITKKTPIDLPTKAIPILSCSQFSFAHPPSNYNLRHIDPQLFALPLDILLSVDHSLQQYPPLHYALGDYLAIKWLDHTESNSLSAEHVLLWSTNENHQEQLCLGHKQNYLTNSPSVHPSMIGLVLGLLKSYKPPS
jgi:repressor LexA